MVLERQPKSGRIFKLHDWLKRYAVVKGFIPNGWILTSDIDVCVGVGVGFILSIQPKRILTIIKTFQILMGNNKVQNLVVWFKMF